MAYLEAIVDGQREGDLLSDGFEWEFFLQRGDLYGPFL
jgi:hypothetical protein